MATARESRYQRKDQQESVIKEIASVAVREIRRILEEWEAAHETQRGRDPYLMKGVDLIFTHSTNEDLPSSALIFTPAPINGLRLA